MKINLKNKTIILIVVLIAVTVVYTGILIVNAQIKEVIHEEPTEHLSHIHMNSQVKLTKITEDTFNAGSEHRKALLNQEFETALLTQPMSREIGKLDKEAKLERNRQELERAKKQEKKNAEMLKNKNIVLYGEGSNGEKSFGIPGHLVYIVNEPKEKEDDILLKEYDVIKAYPHKDFKSYMSWTALSPSSPQGKFSAKAEVDPETAIMMYEDRYLVALGSAYADEVGQKIDIVMESGQIIPAIVGDFKADEHTDEYGSTQRWDGSVVEFIVSSNEEAAEVTKKTGSYNLIFPGLVKEFRK